MTIDTGDTRTIPTRSTAVSRKRFRSRTAGSPAYPERVDGVKRRVRSESFGDYFSQATLFWNSMSPPEKEHIVSAFSFELAKVTKPEIRTRVLDGMLANVDADLAGAVAANLGLPPPVPASKNGARNGSKTKGENAKGKTLRVDASPLLSLLNPQTGKTGIVKGRKVAILAAPGVDGAPVAALKERFAQAGVEALVLAERLGTLGEGDDAVAVDRRLVTMPSVVFDGVIVPGGAAAARALEDSGGAVHFVAESYRHGKPIGAIGEGSSLLEAAWIDIDEEHDGVILGDTAEALFEPFIEALGKHRAWSRDDRELVPA